MATSPKAAAKATATVTEKVIGETEELPKAVVKRVVKEKLSQLSQEGADIQIMKDSLSAFSESARIFIHYLSATANDICKESKRQTINAEDVFKALEEIEFPEFIVSLRTSLEEFKQKNTKRKSDLSKAKEAKKSKTDEPPTNNGEENENGNEEENEVAENEAEENGAEENGVADTE